MNHQIYYAAIFILCIILTASSCNKNQMPDENKDWNVLEWTVDGERAKANCEGDPLFGCDPVDCEYYHDIKYLDVYGTSSGKGGIIIHKHRNLKEGVQNILESNDYMIVGNSVTNDTCTGFVCDTNQQYSLFIEKIDTINKIIVGTFSFTGIDNCQDTARVEDGYFKLRYRP